MADKKKRQCDHKPKATLVKEGRAFCMWCNEEVPKPKAREFEADFTGGGLMGRNRTEY